MRSRNKAKPIRRRAVLDGAFAIWLTQKMMAVLYDVSVSAINQHLKRIFDDGELIESSVIKKYLITANDGTEILTDPGKISAEQAKLHAETEFEKYRIIQDRLFMSDFDRYMLKLEEQTKTIPNKK